MSNTLTDIRAKLHKALESGEQLRCTLEPCVRNTQVFANEVRIIPIWLKRKQEAETEAACMKAEAEAARMKAEAEAALKAQRLQLGVGEPVDLGLSVLWSSRNVGAPSGDQPGYYVGWGDSSGRQLSTMYDDYPCVNSISGTKYDFARQMWKESWRIPTLQEMLELMQQCQWMWTIINGVPGYQVIGKNQKSIFLPAGGDRYGMQYEDAYYVGRYWTATLYEEETARAFFLEFSQQGAQISSLARYMGMLIRPVLNKS